MDETPCTRRNGSVVPAALRRSPSLPCSLSSAQSSLLLTLHPILPVRSGMGRPKRSAATAWWFRRRTGDPPSPELRAFLPASHLILSVLSGMHRPKSKRRAAAAVPDDALVEIFSRLPAKSLCRSKCVSRAWRDLIADRLRCTSLPQTLAGFFYVYDDGDEVCGCRCDGCSSGGECSDRVIGRFVDTTGRSVPLASFSFLGRQPWIKEFGILSSCNGLLLFGHRMLGDSYDSLGYIVCNPATEQWVAVPSSGWKPYWLEEWYEHEESDSDSDTDDESNLRFTYMIFDPATSPHFQLVEFWTPTYDATTVEEVHTYSTNMWDDSDEEEAVAFAAGGTAAAGYGGFLAPAIPVVPAAAVRELQSSLLRSSPHLMPLVSTLRHPPLTVWWFRRRIGDPHPSPFPASAAYSSLPLTLLHLIMSVRSSMGRPKKRRATAATVAVLPDDALADILYRLPAKSLCRSKCVSRSWRDLIAGRLRCTTLPQTLAGFFYVYDDGDDVACRCDGCSSGGGACSDRVIGRFVDTTGRSVPLASFAFLGRQPEIQEFGILRSCNGLVLFGHRRAGDSYDSLGYIVCNPATEQWVAVPSSGWNPHWLAEWYEDEEPDSYTEGGCRFTYMIFDPAVSPHFQLVEFWTPPYEAATVEEVHTYSSVVKFARWSAHRLAPGFRTGTGLSSGGVRRSPSFPNSGSAAILSLLSSSPHLLLLVSIRSGMDRPKKSAAAAPSLPDDALVEILSCLPAKSLCRFKCVSKAWHDLITDRLRCNKLPQTLVGFFVLDEVEEDEDEEIHSGDSDDGSYMSSGPFVCGRFINTSLDSRTSAYCTPAMGSSSLAT
ncbi:hypothetical protein HU200_060956 [Digitaria exilis]|uniref:F-box domain-containing protein n=1 Tax=Digitaria exilis TaxID=1010633 RepID=A0A835A9R2_9POAL|nr:hypothetical protein HU200_060956 [Digitaria exilis]